MNRFWNKVDITLDLNSCWNWQACVDRKGYGRFNYRGINEPTHRYIIEHLHKRKLTTNEYVCHNCDNRRCVRPAHLYVGTARTNAEDRDSRNRGRWEGKKGINNPRAVLTDDDIINIRLLKSIGFTAARISDFYPISRDSIYPIVNRKTWKHIGD